MNDADFGWAIRHLKNGGRVARTGWSDNYLHLELQKPELLSKMTLPYMYMKTADGNLVPWMVSQIDMLAEDWFSVGALGT